MNHEEIHIAMLISQRYAEAHLKFKEAYDKLNGLLYIGSNFLSKEDSEKVRETMAILENNISNTYFSEAEKYAKKEITETISAQY